MHTIGKVYLSGGLFRDEANQTIGQPIVGSEMEQLIENRRRASHRVTEAGKAALLRVKAEMLRMHGLEVELRWDRFCGCAMCPCSPGFRIMARTWAEHGATRDKFQVVFYFDKDGQMEYRPARLGRYSAWAQLESAKEADQCIRIG